MLLLSYLLILSLLGAVSVVELPALTRTRYRSLRPPGFPQLLVKAMKFPSRLADALGWAS